MGSVGVRWGRTVSGWDDRSEVIGVVGLHRRVPWRIIDGVRLGSILGRHSIIELDVDDFRSNEVFSTIHRISIIIEQYLLNNISPQ